MPTSAVSTFSPSGRLDPVYPNAGALLHNVALAEGAYTRGTILGEIIGNNEGQSATITGSPTGGTFTLTFGGQTTTAIAYNATAAAVQAALEALSSIGSDGVTVSGSAGGPYTITFKNQLGYQNVAALTASGAGLTGGTSPGVTIATVTAGSSGTRGTFKAYSSSAVDGSQLAKAILQYTCTVDADGNVSLAFEYGQEQRGAPVYIGGGAVFRTSELVGLDEAAIDALKALLIEGSVASGLLRF